MAMVASNTELLETIRFLKAKAKENKAEIWAAAADQLSRTRSARAEVSLNHIARATKANSVVLVPGKVLGDGYLKHPVVVTAFQFSQGAKQKIEKAGGKCLTIRDFVTRRPKGSNVILMR